MHVGDVWTVLTSPPPSEETERHAAVRELVALDPTTGKILTADDAGPGFDPKHLRRRFRLEQRRFLLGEPIVARLEISLEGPGTFKEPIGGAYRARGRDDNFHFLLRRVDDGTFSADPYAPVLGGRGGLSTTRTVKKEEPLSVWLGVQRWSVVTRPGTYDLICLGKAHDHHVRGDRTAIDQLLPDDLRKRYRLNDRRELVDRTTGQASGRYVSTSWKRKANVSPLQAKVPQDVQRQVPTVWGLGSLTDYARFRIVIEEGTREARAEMASRWRKNAENVHPQMGNRDTAVCDAILFSFAKELLPVVRRWYTSGVHGYTPGRALAMNPDPEAFATLLEGGAKRASFALHSLSARRASRAIPHVIGWIAHSDKDVRRAAVSRLRWWTSTTLHPEWKPHRTEDPEGDALLEVRDDWRAWWKEHGGDDFVPRTRR